ncbi:hypothetical protein [Streptomyces sp. NPDC088812]|uniref:hypothetical protein n=1 Tax=Streptomyces sp. NPDC088812 TaxID=3365905 RepID=UPI0037F58651
MLWGYGHYAAAAVGAGLAVNVAQVKGHSALADVQAAATYTVPVALFITSVWRVTRLSATADLLAPLAVLAVLATTFTTFAVLCTGIIASLLVGLSLVVARREAL